MQKLKLQTADMAERNIETLGQLFPSCLTEKINDEGKLVKAIDFDKLRQELASEVVEGAEERYQFTWPDKRAAVRLANTPTTMTLRPCREESVDFDNTQNLYIEGDNLDVLKVLRETYLGKVKMIYIDPPYNTGNDFVYYDEFDVNKNIEEERNGFWDENGNQTLSNFERNTAANGRFHTDWLNMIYPRLKVARDLLADDGVIFISIGDTEVNNLHKLCNEIYGESNFIANVVIITGANQAGEGVLIQKNIEYVLCYSKNINNAIINRVDKTEESWRNLNDAPTPLITRPDMGYTIYYNPITEEMIPIYDYDKTILHSNDENIIYSTDINLVSKGFVPVRPGKRNGYLHRWRWGIETFKERITEIKMFSNKGNYTPKFMQGGFNPPKNYHNFSGGASELKLLFGEKTPFDYPKGVALLKYIVSIGSKQDSIILDFFSGSATTAHAVMKLNAEDGGNRKFIMVQLPELTDEKSEAYKAGYKNICEIGKERIRRAGRKIKEENASKEGIERLDVGFRVLKLDESNMADVYYTPADTPMQTTFAFDALVDNIREGRTAEDLLFQVLPECNLPLSSKIEEREIHGKKVFVVEDGYLMACFDKNINESVITAIAKEKPYYFVMCDRSMETDNVADNFEQIFEAYSKETVRRIL